MRYLSVCSGIEAASKAWHPLGWTPVAFSEIEPVPCSVLRERFPGVPNLGDFTGIRTRWLRRIGVGAIDVLVGGTPCQSFSVAGLRGGLADARGNLTIEFLALTKRLRPQFVVWENVPGILTIDGGQTFRCILDTFNDLGYAVECDILDAQHHGVPQRRRRVFLVCHNVEHGRRKRTPLFVSTATTCLTDVLLSILAAHADPSSIGAARSAWPSRFSGDGLTRRMRLFGIASGDLAAASRLLDDLGDACRKSLPGHDDSDCPFRRPDRRPCASTGTSSSDGASGGVADTPRSWSTLMSWSDIWAAAFDLESASTTSTGSRTTTESTISICAAASLSIARSMLRFSTSFPNSCDGDSCGLTALKAFTNYARSASADLFRQLGGGLHWHDFVRAATPVIESLERHLGDRANTGTLFPLPESLSGDPPPGRAARQDVAASLGGGSGERGWCDDLDRAGAFVPDAAHALRGKHNLNHREDGDTLITGTLNAVYAKQSHNGMVEMANGLIAHAPDVAFGLQSSTGRNENGSRIGNAWNTNYVAHTLRADGFDASEDGTGRGTPLVPVAFNWQGGGKQTSLGFDPGSQITGTLGVGQEIAVAYQCQGSNVGPMGTIRSGNGNTTGGVPFVIQSATQGEKAQNGLGVEQSETMYSLTSRDQHAVAAFDPRNVTSNVNRTRVEPGLPCPTLHEQGMSIIGQGVRRLTPVECERLQGFPDDWTLVMHKGKPTADGPRYKACGNSMAVVVMAWLGIRIDLVCRTLSLKPQP